MTRLSPLFALGFLAACDGDKDVGADDTASTDDTGITTDDTGTDDTGDTAEPQDIEIQGSWVDNWGTTHQISNEVWMASSANFAISQHSAGHAIAQNDAANEWNPELWSRFDWGWAEDELYVCQTAYAEATEADALATPAADIDDLSAGCGGFSWSQLRTPLAVSGSYDDAWGSTHLVSAFSWDIGTSTFAISQADDAGQWAVAQNGADNSWNPELWSRFDWAWDSDSTLYYCQTAYAAASEAEALAASADSSDLSSGCGGFSWTAMRPSLSINGTWTDGWGGGHIVTAWAWTSGESGYSITESSDDEGWIVAQNGADNSWNPELWSRFDWTWHTDGTLYFCQTAYAAATEADARATPAADATDPTASGCGSFSWTSLAQS